MISQSGTHIQLSPGSLSKRGYFVHLRDPEKVYTVFFSVTGGREDKIDLRGRNTPGISLSLFLRTPYLGRTFTRSP